MVNTKQERVLEIFFRTLRGEGVSVKKLAEEYQVSSKSINRSINDLKAFLANHRMLVGNAELQYSYQNKSYYLYMDEFLSSKELFAVVEILIGARALSKMELLVLIDKLKKFTTVNDRNKLAEIIAKEVYHYAEVKHDCDGVQDMLWKVINCISQEKEITIDYYKMNRNFVTHRIMPVAVMFSDYYFYLIAFNVEGDSSKALYFRIDRIKDLTVHRNKINEDRTFDFDEGLLRQRSLLMWPGVLRTIRFEFTGPSVQAVLDKLPTAKIISNTKGRYLIEAQVYGDGIKMWLLSQGSWVKVISPEAFVLDMKNEIQKMVEIYMKE